MKTGSNEGDANKSRRMVLYDTSWWRKVQRRENFFGFYFCYGVALLLGLQTFINIGVASGLLPTKGLTLPLVSGGGTNLIIVCIMIGLILRIDYENKISMPVPMIKRRV